MSDERPGLAVESESVEALAGREVFHPTVAIEWTPEEARRRKSAPLRMYLGAAPVVGKTYAMLSEGRCRRDRGTDVVVGFVATYGRKQTIPMFEGLEIVPMQTLEYRGRLFDGMDVHAIIHRRPQVALVDELAHTNIPGARHAKRWEDGVEVLAAGIEVITTINIQHLENLNDVIANVTVIRQSETIPDWLFDLADQVELVDMSPHSLRRRMAHGNVYPDARKAELAPSRIVFRDASNRALSCAGVGQCGSGRWTLGRLTAETGFAVMSPSSTAWRSAEPSRLRTWAIVVPETPHYCIRVSTVRTCPGLTSASSRLPITFWPGLAAMLSVALGRAATSALVAIAAWLVLALFWNLLVGVVADALVPVPDQFTVEEQVRNLTLEQRLGRVSPSRLYEEVTYVLLTPEANAGPYGFLLPRQVDRVVFSTLSLAQSLLLVWPQVVAMVALTVICFAVAYVLFMHQEIRA